MKNIAKLTSYGCYLDCDFVTAKYPGDETHIVGNVAEYVYDLEQKISDLEAKLAESEIRSKESEIFYKREINRRDTKLRNIKQQLAEKEKEIEELKNIHIYDKTIEIFSKGLAQKNQDKILFAVEQLEKVKEWCENHKFSDEYDYVIAYEADEEDASGCEDYLKECVDNQIKQLKETIK